ncbi:type VI secretion system lipoprotein TssJ [Trinickia caryophylli]|uniref:Type VI secretion system protein VasD n=1 Tax=Trinickia caryophylli TaxID=28094 RepID=A0A1X7DG59_TRICW|nr:type VI secretion system lipoprotein TssJ [Trinickia caryophylli]WQE12323.1 type VI secretion system lipoprotein TssJ [Trinickia caryophylli]GLU31531.1 type VI secretion system protein VasD [Trinickia caryophylli]SMF15113.1 type VI secretion system protein VasD [Trinickia caryophylli]
MSAEITAVRKQRWIAASLLASALSGCGAWQSVKNGTVDATRAIFVAKVDQMNLVVASRAALNQNDRGQSLPVVMRIYQLKDAKGFEKAGYGPLLADDRDVLKTDLVGRMEITLDPGATIRLSETMPDSAQDVGIVAFFRDQTHAQWQLVIPKSQWKKTDPVTLVVSGNHVDMAPPSK